MVRPDVLDRFAVTFESKGFNRAALHPATAWPRPACHHLPSGLATACAPTPSTATAPAEAQRAEPATNPSDSDRAATLRVAARRCRDIASKCATAEASALADRAVGAHLRRRVRASCRAISSEPEAQRARSVGRRLARYRRPGRHADGEIVVTRRAKDLIIVNGRNVWPQDIEWAIEAKKVVKNGDAAAFSDRVPPTASGSWSRRWRAWRATRRGGRWRAT